MGYGFDDEMNETANEANEVIVLDDKKKRKPFAYWEVGGQAYKLKLTTSTILKLEEKFKRNLLDLLNGVPPLSIMLTITQAAMKDWNHSISFVDVQKLFDLYCEEGGTQLTFMTDVLMEIYKVSGFFSANQAEAMDEKLQDVREKM